MSAPRDTHARLFVAFPVSGGASLSAALKKLKITADRHRMEMNWVPTATWHVTLNFLGDTERARLDMLTEVLASITAEQPPITSSLRGLGAFPDDHHMRVLWAGVRKSRALSALQSCLRDALVAAGFPQEDREYSPHLTLARLRKQRSGRDLISPFVRTAFQDLEVRSIKLYESFLQGGAQGVGPVYNALREFPLSGTSTEESDSRLA